MNQEPIPAVIETNLFLFKTIYRMAGNAKTNLERCQELARKVRSLEKMVLRIQQRGLSEISSSLEETLRDLCHTLHSTEVWMMKCTQTKRFSLKSNSHDEKFKKLDKRLSEIFQELSVALLEEQRGNVDMVYANLQRGPAVSRHQAPIRSFSFPQPTPTYQALMPSSPPLTPQLPLGPYGFSLDLNYGPYGQTPAFNPVVPQPMPQPSISFPNNTIGYPPPSAPPTANIPKMTPMSSIQLYSSTDSPQTGQ